MEDVFFFKLKILDLKITIIEMKNSLHGLKSRMEMAEGGSSEKALT